MRYWVILVLCLLWCTCQEMPSKPTYENPFDTENPVTAGEPFYLRATLANGGIALSWSGIPHSQISGFVIHRRMDRREEFVRLDTTTASDTTWVDRQIDNGHSYWYFVSAFNGTEESRRTNVTTVRVNTDPELKIDGGATFAASRQVELTLVATLAEEMWLSHFADFSDGQWEPFAAKKSFSLTTGAGEKSVFLKVKYADSTISSVVSAKINPHPMKPVFSIENGAADTPSRSVWIRNQVEGHPISLRISENDLTQAPWQAFQDSLQFHLSVAPETKTVYAQFRNDFEIESEIISQTIRPVPVQSAEILINQGAKYCKNAKVNLSLNAHGAQHVKISENAELTGATWQRFQPALSFELSAEDGPKTIYFKFLNDFTQESGIFQQQIILDQTPPTAQLIVAPAFGTTEETWFEFDASTSSDNLTAPAELEVRWDWQNDGIFDTPWSSEKKVTRNFESGGTKTILLEVRDAAGWTDTIVQQITVNSRPVAQFTANPRIGRTSTIFQFNASASYDPDGENILFRWDLNNDGSWETDWQTDAQISFQFNRSGSYPATLQVKDPHNSVQTIQKFVLVVDPTPLVTVPAGEFTMGSPDGVGDSDEQPLHPVYLDEFSMDQFEVTNLQFAEFLSTGNASHFHPKMKIQQVEDDFYVPLPGFAQHPVVYVSYPAALAYAQWRGKSLPTEAQWEKAARGTQQRIYPWGNGLETNNANYWQSGDPFENITAPLTTPVGFYNGDTWQSYQTRDSHGPYGTFDLAGNVAEWCLDWYQTDAYTQYIPPNPTGPTRGNNRVVRGGSWADDAYHLRSAARAHQAPYEGSAFLGFRCVGK